MKVLSPAKINWFLYVTGKRKDGFHDIISPAQEISLYDEIYMEDSKDISLEDDSGIAENIILKVIEKLRARKNYDGSGVEVRLKKIIPLSAGMGGGSSNAATVLKELNNRWRLGLNSDELHSLASETGSDVPFFLSGSLSVMTGRGDELMNIDSDMSYDLLLVNPGLEISSGWAYKGVSEYRSINEDELIREFTKAHAEKDIDSLRRMMINDLESPVMIKFPIIGDLKDRMLRAGAKLALMSGSGSTVFGVFESASHAISASGEFSGFWNKVVRTI